MSKARKYGGERQVRLKPQHADLYRGILPGEWVPAPVMVERLLALAVAAGVSPHARVCDPRHFQFRGGVSRASELNDLRTRRSDVIGQ
jgi:hypothetical protein